MKAKLLQILLGAVGSAVTVIITHLAAVPDGAATSVALAAGPAATLVGAKVSAFIQTLS